MVDSSVAIRLGTSGVADVKRDLTSIGDTGEAQASRWSKAFEKATDDIAAAEQRRARAADKISAMLPSTSTQQVYQAGASTNYDGGSAKASADAFRELLAVEDALDAKARALTAVLEPLRVAQEQYDEEVALASRLHDTGRISLDAFVASEQRAALALEKVTGAQRSANEATAAANRYQTTPDTMIVGKSAQQSAAAMQELLMAEEKLQQRTDALRASIDPAYAAQKRFDGEIGNARDLVSKGAISLDDYCAKLRVERTVLDQATRGHSEHAGMLGLNRSQFITAQSAAIRFTDSIIAGASPLRAFALEAHKGVEVLSMDDDGMAGGLSKVSALLTPMTIGVAAATAAVVIGAYAWLSYAESIEKLEALAQGAGRLIGESGEQLQADAADAAAKAGTMTVSTARTIEQAYLGVARSREVLIDLTSLTADFAAATGQKAEQAAAELAKMFADPIASARELADKYGLLDEAEVAHIATLVEEGKQTEAQIALYRDMAPAFDGAAEHAEGLTLVIHRIGLAASDSLEQIGKMLDGIGRGQKLTGSGWNLFGGLYGGLYGNNATAPPGQGTGPIDPQAARKTAERAQADAITRQYQGDNRAKFSTTIGQLRQAISAGGTPDEMKAWTEALAANEHALSTWVPAADKANLVAAATAKVRQAATPAARAAAKADLDRVKALGEVVTAENVRARADDRAEGYHNRANSGAAKHAETLRREAESMDVAARSSLTLADAYLTGGSAAVVAEAHRKAATDATRKGIDVDAQAQRQLALNVAEQIASSAKSVDQLRAETVARAAANDNVAAGTLDASQLNRALSDETALRPLLILRTLAHGDELERLTKVIDAYRAGLKAAHEEEDRSTAATTLVGLNDRSDEARADLTYVGDTSGRRDRSRVRREAERQTRGWTDRDGALDVQSQTVGAFDAELTTRRADAAESARKASADQLAMTTAEIGLIGKSADEHDRVVNRLALEQKLATELGDQYDEFAPAVLAAADATEAANEKLRTLSTAWDEVKQAGDQFIDDVFNPDGSGLMTLLHDAETELLKLAAINPLKNMLFGESNATLGSIFGNLGSLFGGGGSDLSFSSMAAGNAAALAGLPHNASGTESWSGGMTWVDENGPEIADLPNGTRIYPAATSRQMMAANDGGMGAIHIDASLSIAGNADGATVEQLRSMQADQERRLKSQIVPLVQEAFNRRVLKAR